RRRLRRIPQRGARPRRPGWKPARARSNATGARTGRALESNTVLQGVVGARPRLSGASDSDVAADGLRPHLDERPVGRRSLGVVELRDGAAARRPAVHPGAGAAADADPDVARDGLELRLALRDRVDALVAGDGLDAGAARGLADLHVAGHAV